MSKQIKRVAVIGFNSFVGRNFVEMFKEKFDFTLIGGTKYKHLEHFEFIDFRYPERKFDYNLLLSFDAILNFSGGGVQSNSVETNIDIYRINLFFPIEIIGFLAENKFQGKFFSFGSYFEIGFNDEKKYFTEEEICKSDGKVPNIYCDTKRLLTKHFSNRIHDLKWFHLILPNIYGYGENDNRLIPYLISSLKKGQPLRLSSGEQVRQYLHVKDLCRLIFELIERDVRADIYTVPSFEQNIQIKNLINNIFNFYSKKENEWEVVQTRDQAMSVLLLDGTKIKNMLPNWRPEISLNQGIAEYI